MFIVRGWQGAKITAEMTELPCSFGKVAMTNNWAKPHHDRLARSLRDSFDQFNLVHFECREATVLRDDEQGKTEERRI